MSKTTIEHTLKVNWGESRVQEIWMLDSQFCDDLPNIIERYERKCIYHALEGTRTKINGHNLRICRDAKVLMLLPSRSRRA